MVSLKSEGTFQCPSDKADFGEGWCAPGTVKDRESRPEELIVKDMHDGKKKYIIIIAVCMACAIGITLFITMGDSEPILKGAISKCYVQLVAILSRFPLRNMTKHLRITYKRGVHPVGLSLNVQSVQKWPLRKR